MLKSFMYIKNYKRIILILAFLLVYISMYLIHNVYGPLCIIKSSNSSSNSISNGDKSNEGDIEVSKLYKVNNSNLFVSNVQRLEAKTSVGLDEWNWRRMISDRWSMIEDSEEWQKLVGRWLNQYLN